MIVLDTNALLYAIQNKIRIEDYCAEEIVIPSSVIIELSRLSLKNRNAKIALEMTKNYKIIEVVSRGDEGIIEAARISGGSVITSDQALRKRLSKDGIKNFSIGVQGVRE